MLTPSVIQARFTCTTPIKGQCHPHPFRRPAGYDRRSVQFQRMMTFQLFIQGQNEAITKAVTVLPERTHKSSAECQRLQNFLLSSPSPKNGRTMCDVLYPKERKSGVDGLPTDYQRLLDFVVSSVDYDNVLTPEDLSTSLRDLYDNHLRELETSFRDSFSITQDTSSTDHDANERVTISEEFILARINPGTEPDQIGERRSVQVVTLKKLATAALPPTREHNRQESETVLSAELEKEGIQDESETEDALLKIDPTEGDLPISDIYLSNSSISLLLDVAPSSLSDKENKSRTDDQVKCPGDVVQITDIAINRTLDTEGTSHQPLGQCKLPDLEIILPTTSLGKAVPKKDSNTSTLPACDVAVHLDTTQIVKEKDEVLAESAGVGTKDAIKPGGSIKRNVKEIDTADDLVRTESAEVVKKQRPASTRRLRRYSKSRIELEQLTKDPAGNKPSTRDDLVKPTELVESSIKTDECQKPMEKVDQTLEMEPPVVNTQPKYIYLNAEHSFMDNIDKVDGFPTKLSNDAQDPIIDTSRIQDIVMAKLREIRAESEVLDLEPDETTQRLWNESLEGMKPSTSNSLSKDSSSSLSRDSSGSLSKDRFSSLSKDSSRSVTTDKKMSCKDLSPKERLEMRKRRFGETVDNSSQTKTNDKRRKIVLKRIVF